MRTQRGANGLLYVHSWFFLSRRLADSPICGQMQTDTHAHCTNTNAHVQMRCMRDTQIRSMCEVHLISPNSACTSDYVVRFAY